MSIILSGRFDRETAEALSDRASQSDLLGYPASATFEDPDDPSMWTVDIYPQDEHSLTVLIQELGEIAEQLEHKALPDDVDWVLEGLKDLKPVSVGRFFVHGAHDLDKVQPHQHAVQIDANQAFGTGHHGTTAGCLEAIERVTKRHDFINILDLGTGSGVLAAAVAKQTKQPVLATDIDAMSVKIARENMELNGVGQLVHCETAAGFHHPVFTEKGPFGLVIANILAKPLQTLARPMSEHLAANATIILSGLLIHQKSAVLAAYRAQGAILVDSIHREGWATLILNRP